MGLSHFGQDQSTAAHDNDGKIGMVQGGVACCGGGGLQKPGLIRLDAVNTATGVITPYYLWVSNAGALRIQSAIPTDADNGGALV
jgi:hypothetical protein